MMRPTFPGTVDLPSPVLCPRRVFIVPIQWKISSFLARFCSCLDVLFAVLSRELPELSLVLRYSLSRLTFRPPPLTALLLVISTDTRECSPPSEMSTTRPGSWVCGKECQRPFPEYVGSKQIIYSVCIITIFWLGVGSAAQLVTYRNGKIIHMSSQQ